MSTVLKNIGGGYSVSSWTVVRAQSCEPVEGLKVGLEIRLAPGVSAHCIPEGNLLSLTLQAA